MEERDPKIWKWKNQGGGYGYWARREVLRAAKRRRYARIKGRPEVREAARQRTHAYVTANREKARASVRATQARNRIRDREAGRILRSTVYSAKDRAKKAGLPFDLDFKKLIIPELCPVLGIKLSYDQRATTPSLDRVVPELGYTMANVRIISQRANELKSNATVAEMEMILAYMQTNMGVGTAHSSQPPEPRQGG